MSVLDSTMTSLTSMLSLLYVAKNKVGKDSNTVNVLLPNGSVIICSFKYSPSSNTHSWSFNISLNVRPTMEFEYKSENNSSLISAMNNVMDAIGVALKKSLFGSPNEHSFTPHLLRMIKDLHLVANIIRHVITIK